MSDTITTAAPQGLGFAQWQAQVIVLIQGFGVSREAATLMVDPDKPAVMAAYKAAAHADTAAAAIAGIVPVPEPDVVIHPAAVTPAAPAIEALNEGDVQASDPKPKVEGSTEAEQGGFGAWVSQVQTQIKRYGIGVPQAQTLVEDNLAKLELAFGESQEPEAAAQELVDANKGTVLDSVGFMPGYMDWLFQVINGVVRAGISRTDAEAIVAGKEAEACAAFAARTDAPTFAVSLVNVPAALPNQIAATGGLAPAAPAPVTPPVAVHVPMPAAPSTPAPDLRGGYGDWTFEVIRQLRRVGMSPMDAQGMVVKRLAQMRAAFEAGQEPEVTAKDLVGGKPLKALDDSESVRATMTGIAKESQRGPVNVFKAGDKVISLDGNKDLTVTHQQGYKVYVKGQAQPIHANRLKLASGKAPTREVMDDAGDDESALDEADDFDPEAEFDGMPDDEDAPDQALDGDFPGHPFRGNQWRKTSRESGTAVHASMKAKRAEGKGDHKATKSAHKAAHHAHMAAAEGSTGAAKHYHDTMAAFHGARAKRGFKLDDVEEALDAVPQPSTSNDTAIAAIFKLASDDWRAAYAEVDKYGESKLREDIAASLLAHVISHLKTKKPSNVFLGVTCELAIENYEKEVLGGVRLSKLNAGQHATDNPMPFFKKAIDTAWGKGSFDYLKFQNSKASLKSEYPEGKRPAWAAHAALDAVEEVPGLRAAIMATTDTMRRLFLVRAIWDARRTPELGNLPGITAPTAGALALMRMSQASGQQKNAYTAAVAINAAILSAGIEGIGLRWNAAAADTVAMDAADLFGGAGAEVLRCDVAYRGRIFASVYVRGDGSAKIAPAASMSMVGGWDALVEDMADTLGPWHDGQADAELIGQALAGGVRGSGGEYESLAGLLEVQSTSELLPADAPGYEGDKPEPVTNAQRELAVVDALQDAGWQTRGVVASLVDGDVWTHVQAEYGDADESGGLSWNIRKSDGQDRTLAKSIDDVPGNDPKLMAELIVMEANTLLLNAERNDLGKLADLDKLAPKDAIRSDDPNLIPKLQAKLAALQARQDFMKKANKLLKGKNDAGLRAMGFSDGDISRLKTPDFAGRTGFADYQLTNNNGVISSTRKRLEQAMQDAQRQAEPEPQPEPALVVPVVPSKPMAEIALGALKALGWAASQYGADILVRSFVGMGRVGTVVTPDGVRNLYARVTDGELVVNFGDAKVARASLVGTDAEVEATARSVNTTVEQFAEAEGKRTNPPKPDPEAAKALGAAAFARGAMMQPSHDPALQAMLDPYGAGSQPWKDLITAWNRGFSEANVAANKPPEPTPGLKFRYALVNRPADLGAIPKGLAYEVEPRPVAGQPHHDMARHGILVVERELTADEVKAFELAPLVDGADLAQLADKVVEATGEYAAGYVRMAGKNPEQFADKVLRTAEKGDSGIRYSIGDPVLLVQMVLDKLNAMIPAPVVTPEPTPPVVTPDPQPAPVSGADQAKAADLALLSLVASGKHPDMLEPELADQIEAAMGRWADDKQVQDLANEAINAFSNGLMAATG